MMRKDRKARIARRFDAESVRRMSRAEVGRWFQRLLPPCHGPRDQRERERGELEPEDLRSESESEKRRKRRHTALNESDPIKGK